MGQANSTAAEWPYTDFALPANLVAPSFPAFGQPPSPHLKDLESSRTLLSGLENLLTEEDWVHDAVSNLLTQYVEKISSAAVVATSDLTAADEQDDDDGDGDGDGVADADSGDDNKDGDDCSSDLQQQSPLPSSYNATPPHLLHFPTSPSAYSPSPNFFDPPPYQLPESRSPSPFLTASGGAGLPPRAPATPAAPAAAGAAAPQRDQVVPQGPLKRLSTRRLVAVAVERAGEVTSQEAQEVLEAALLRLARAEYDWLVATIQMVSASVAATAAAAAVAAAEARRRKRRKARGEGEPEAAALGFDFAGLSALAFGIGASEQTLAYVGPLPPVGLDPLQVEEVFVLGLAMWVEFWKEWGKPPVQHGAGGPGGGVTGGGMGGGGRGSSGGSGLECRGRLELESPIGGGGAGGGHGGMWSPVREENFGRGFGNEDVVGGMSGGVTGGFRSATFGGGDYGMGGGRGGRGGEGGEGGLRSISHADSTGSGRGGGERALGSLGSESFSERRGLTRVGSRSMSKSRSLRESRSMKERGRSFRERSLREGSLKGGRSFREGGGGGGVLGDGGGPGGKLSLASIDSIGQSDTVDVGNFFSVDLSDGDSNGGGAEGECEKDGGNDWSGVGERERGRGLLGGVEAIKEEEEFGDVDLGEEEDLSGDSSGVNGNGMDSHHVGFETDKESRPKRERMVTIVEPLEIEDPAGADEEDVTVMNGYHYNEDYKSDGTGLGGASVVGSAFESALRAEAGRQLQDKLLEEILEASSGRQITVATPGPRAVAAGARDVLGAGGGGAGVGVVTVGAVVQGGGLVEGRQEERRLDGMAGDGRDVRKSRSSVGRLGSSRFSVESAVLSGSNSSSSTSSSSSSSSDASGLWGGARSTISTVSTISSASTFSVGTGIRESDVITSMMGRIGISSESSAASAEPAGFAPGSARGPVLGSAATGLGGLVMAEKAVPNPAPLHVDVVRLLGLTAAAASQQPATAAVCVLRLLDRLGKQDWQARYGKKLEAQHGRSGGRGEHGGSDSDDEENDSEDEDEESLSPGSVASGWTNGTGARSGPGPGFGPGGSRTGGSRAGGSRAGGSRAGGRSAGGDGAGSTATGGPVAEWEDASEAQECREFVLQCLLDMVDAVALKCQIRQRPGASYAAGYAGSYAGGYGVGYAGGYGSYGGYGDAMAAPTPTGQVSVIKSFGGDEEFAALLAGSAAPGGVQGGIGGGRVGGGEAAWRIALLGEDPSQGNLQGNIQGSSHGVGEDFMVASSPSGQKKKHRRQRSFVSACPIPIVPPPSKGRFDTAGAAVAAAGAAGAGAGGGGVDGLGPAPLVELAELAVLRAILQSSSSIAGTLPAHVSASAAANSTSRTPSMDFDSDPLYSHPLLAPLPQSATPPKLRQLDSVLVSTTAAGPGLLVLLIATEAARLPNLAPDDLWLLADRSEELRLGEASVRIRIRACASTYDDPEGVRETVRMALVPNGAEPVPNRIVRLLAGARFALLRAQTGSARREFASVFGSALLEPILGKEWAREREREREREGVWGLSSVGSGSARRRERERERRRRWRKLGKRILEYPWAYELANGFLELSSLFKLPGDDDEKEEEREEEEDEEDEEGGEGRWGIGEDELQETKLLCAKVIMRVSIEPLLMHGVDGEESGESEESEEEGGRDCGSQIARDKCESIQEEAEEEEDVGKRGQGSGPGTGGERRTGSTTGESKGADSRGVVSGGANSSRSLSAKARHRLSVVVPEAPVKAWESDEVIKVGGMGARSGASEAEREEEERRERRAARRREQAARKEEAVARWAREVEYPEVEVGWAQWKAIGCLLGEERREHRALVPMWGKAVRGSFKAVLQDAVPPDPLMLELFDWGLEGLLISFASASDPRQHLPRHRRSSSSSSSKSQGQSQSGSHSRSSSSSTLSPVQSPSLSSDPPTSSSTNSQLSASKNATSKPVTAKRPPIPSSPASASSPSSSSSPRTPSHKPAIPPPRLFPQASAAASRARMLIGCSAWIDQVVAVVCPKEKEVAELLMAVATRMAARVFYRWPRHTDNVRFIARLLLYVHRQGVGGMGEELRERAVRISRQLWGWSLPSFASIRMQCETDEEAHEIMLSAIVATWKGFAT
ncbi:hypothetical protein CLOM_g12421 [Closterium sp. NIES-68]|nr:hypothetical protein CLOM_g12421 [Closterium sp. NIES-68]GJP72488.1 hypothetical protein CLOP_g3218 [Closterium sp. NIES-67]